MDRQKQLEVINELDKKLVDVIISKGNDYAAEGEVLGNFKRLSKMVEILRVNLSTPEGYALFMVLLKIDRITNLLSSGKTPDNESIEDSFADGINYFKLAYCCYKDTLESNLHTHSD